MLDSVRVFVCLHSRKHGEGFFRWIHGSYHHENHCKELSTIISVIAQSHHHHENHYKELSSSESFQRVIIIMRVIAKSYHPCTESSSSESLQRVIITRVIAKSYHHQSHCKELSSSESLHRVIIIRIIAKSHHHQSHCTESSSSSESLHRVIIIRVIAHSHSRESLARSNAHESPWRGAMLMRVTCEEQCSRAMLIRVLTHDEF